MTEQMQEDLTPDEDLTPLDDLSSDDVSEPNEQSNDEPDAQPVAREWSDDDADEARAFGWKSPDEWKGEKPKGYIDDPRRYLERISGSTPFKKMQADFEERTRKLEAVTQRVLADQQARHQAELERIRAEKLKAVDLADVDAYRKLDEQEKALSQPEQPRQPDADPFIQDYVARNPWVQNPMLQKVGAALVDANPAIAASDAKTQFEYAERQLRVLHPEFFPAAPAAPKPAPRRNVDAGGLAVPNAGGDPMAKLPSEAKAAFKKFVAQGIFKDTAADRKRYADDYNAG